MGNKPRVIASLDKSPDNKSTLDSIRSGTVEGLVVSLEDSHHLVNVLRLKTGSEVEVFFPNLSKSFSGRLNSSLTEIILIAELEKQFPKIKVHLIVALIKPSLCELIVEKCTELGAFSINFFQPEFHREGASYEEFKKRIARLNKIRDSAIKQSRTFVSTELKLASSLKEALKEFNSKAGLYLSMQQDPGIIEVLASSKAKLEQSGKIDDLYLIIGPEAGLTEAEIEIAKAAGAIGVSLGGNILRTETAAIVTSGIVMSFAW